jgi:hypothetical protein
VAGDKMHTDRWLLRRRGRLLTALLVVAAVSLPTLFAAPSTRVFVVASATNPRQSVARQELLRALDQRGVPLARRVEDARVRIEIVSPPRAGVDVLVLKLVVDGARVEVAGRGRDAFADAANQVHRWLDRRRAELSAAP